MIPHTQPISNHTRRPRPLYPVRVILHNRKLIPMHKKPVQWVFQRITLDLTTTPNQYVL